MQMAAQGPPPTEDLTATCWRDDVWLRHYGLNPANALDYFALTPFYDRTCNNELAKLRGIRPEHLPTLAPGVEYVLRDAQPPHLFVIRKHWRAGPSSPEGSEVPLAYYYILDGTVYQAPSLHAVLSSRVRRCVFQLRAAFDAMQADLDPLTQGAELRSSLDAELAAARAAAGSTAGTAAGGGGRRPGVDERERAQRVEANLRLALAKHPVAVPAAGGAAPTASELPTAPPGSDGGPVAPGVASGLASRP